MESMTRLELVQNIIDPKTNKPMSPLNKLYKEKILEYLVKTYDMSREFLDVRFKGHKSASKFVSSVIQRFRESHTKFDRMKNKFRDELSLQHNYLKIRY